MMGPYEGPLNRTTPHSLNSLFSKFSNMFGGVFGGGDWDYLRVYVKDMWGGLLEGF
jgi:hypothetical protein